MVELPSFSAEETERIAAAVARELGVGDVVTVAGELGAGKTTFVRGACRELGVTRPITSPTYTIGHRYAGQIDVAHLDLYRLQAMSEADWGDLEEYFEGTVTFVEWPEVAEEFLPAVRVAVRLQLLGPEHRLIVLQASEKSLEIAVSSLC